MKIFEIFQSIDGEVNLFHQGRLTTFIRFAGCNLDCPYCDTRYCMKMSDGKEMSVTEVTNELSDIGNRKITITGGEPLVQREEFNVLTQSLWHLGFNITVETNGSLPLSGFGVASWIVDFKLPSSKYYDRMDMEMFSELGVNDFIKFVISDRNDYDTAIMTKNILQADGCHANFAFSPVFGPKGIPTGVAEHIVKWLIDDKIFDAIVNVQIHKLLGVQ